MRSPSATTSSCAPSRAASPRAPAAQLAALVALVHAWRRFPFIDPEIPAELLPADWVGWKAKGFFDERHARWTPGAKLAFEQLEDANG